MNRAEGGNGKGRKRKRKGSKYGDRIDQIYLEAGRPHIAIAQGTTVPLRFSCVEINPDGSKPVRAAITSGSDQRQRVSFHSTATG